MKVLVVGRAKTGTTIIAKTLQNSIENAGFIMEPKNSNLFLADYPESLVVKVIYEHWGGQPEARLALINNELSLQFDKCILIIRDPRDELISRMFYIVYGYIKQGLVTRKHLQPWLEIIREKEKNPELISVQQLMTVLNRLLDIRMNWNLNSTFEYFSFVKAEAKKNKGLVLRYEDFITNKLQDVENYLGLTISGERSVGQCSNRVRRSASHNNWKSFFLPSDLEAFKTRHFTEMRAMGYTDWELAEIPSLNPEHGTVYLERIMDEAEARFAKSTSA